MTLRAPSTQQKFTDKVLDILRDPSSLPPEFASWVRGQIVRNPTVKLDAYQLPSVEKKHVVGASGEPAFLNSWVPYGGAYEGPSFFKDLSGIVHLQGLCRFGTIGASIWTLPVGYRPSATLIFDAQANGAIAQINVTAAGDVIALVGNNTWF